MLQLLKSRVDHSAFSSCAQLGSDFAPLRLLALRALRLVLVDDDSNNLKRRFDELLDRLVDVFAVR